MVNGIITTKKISELGIRRSALSKLTESGELVKCSRGIYMFVDEWEDEFYLLQKRYSRGVFSHATALYLQGYSERVPISFHMTFVNNYNSISLKEEKDYNTTLNAEVKEKTEYIRRIQQNILEGMANLIENRDSNTGGHVKRTSDGVRILIEEMNRTGVYKIDDRMSAYIAASAPMHDLGKITIDSYILCKPGKLTDEEFAIMKSHAVKSGEIVNILLEGVEEKDFVDTCYKVARYHHEKWDGTGYPEGLKGEEIPLGARVMAVADALDALLAKRCYKEPMSFDKAREIILDGMGKNFDSALEPVFLGCEKKLEKYYKNIEWED